MRGEKTQDQAGHAALSIAFRYVSQANWSMAYTFFRTCIRKENKLLNERMNELLLLEKAASSTTLAESLQTCEIIIQNLV